ncbi:beta-ketoacyl-[acyl-carrier-protein] synthase family protein [Paraliobacillus sp. JSM ZJ581]|uniref:beta-ketoacyl-[acyl-carrier-protein] synthase family protein n=1 Tax=Paraliobacillus sp. JSM ZJ581 TaxID=3342118 RepID=UPI0035A8D6C7
MSERVVVTGMGAVVSCSDNLIELWHNVITKKLLFDYQESFKRVAGPTPSPLPEINRYENMIEHAIQEAISPCLLPNRNEEVISFILGTSIGDSDIIKKFETLSSKFNNSPRYFNSNDTVKEAINKLQINGRINVISSACSSSSVALNNAYNLIKNGKSDMVCVVGIENVSNNMGIASFDALSVLSKDTSPHLAMQPFDNESNSFVMSDGCGVLILESLSLALKNNKKIYSEISGVGMSCDAYNILTPDQTGTGAVKAMHNALIDANLSPESISYVNVHGTGTNSNDDAELKAMQQVFPCKKNRDYFYATSTKSITGHLLGASGIIEAIISTISLIEGVIPATVNLSQPLVSSGITINNDNVKKELSYVMSNTFAFGGQNVSLILKKYTKR